jgi:hypothetical protein
MKIMNINLPKHCVLLGMVLIGVSLSLPAAAQARGGGHGGGGYSGGHGGGHGGGYSGGYSGGHGGGWRDGSGWWGLGLGLGLGWEAAYFGNPYFYYPPPTYYYPYSSPTVIVESPSLQMPPQQQTAVGPQNSPPAPNWYYCESAKGYYPYVTQCPEPWRVVPAVPPAPTR